MELDKDIRELRNAASESANLRLEIGDLFVEGVPLDPVAFSFRLVILGS